MIVVITLIRLFLWWRYPYSDTAVFSIVNRFDCMMIVAVGSFLYFKRNILFMKLVDNKMIQTSAWFIVLLLALNFKLVNSVVDTSIVAIVSLFLIIGQINIKNRIVNLDIRVLNYLGKISYGIYVYHVIIIYFMSIFFKDLQADVYLNSFIIYFSVIVITIVISHFSYELFEKRFIILKDKFAIIKSTASPK